MLQELLQTCSGDRLISGQYKSYGNLVNLKVEVIDAGDFQRHGCLANPGPGTCQPHSHHITGTLFCNPENGKATLNITLLGPANNDASQWPQASPPRPAEPVLKSPWMASNNVSLKEVPYSVYSAPVSPPSLPQDVPPPLLDFASEQLMTDIQNMAFDLKDSLSSHIPYSDNPPVSLPAPLPSPQGNTSHLQNPSQETATHLVNKSFSVSQAPGAYPGTQSTAKSPSSMPGLPSSPTAQPCLLQPKLERSDSICSEYTPGQLKEEYLSYTEELCGSGLNDLDDTDNSAPPPSNESSHHMFSPSHTSIQNSSNQTEKQGTFFSKSFESKNQTKPSQNEAFDSLFSSSVSSPKTTSSPTLFSNGNSAFSLSLQPSPKPYLLSHIESPQLTSSPSSSSTTSEMQDTPITLLTSPKSRNRRNSSFDETKPHVCPQCAARFTTKSNLGQHAKIHLAVKPFICEICSHGFTRAAHYESHVAKHKGLKTHRCEQCGESFARLDNLLRHSARHKHGKIFDCNLCGKGFHRKDKLLEHEKVHSEYSFPCPKCSKTFHTNDALKHHLPLHEDSSKSQCKICFKFITIKSMAKHMSSFHKEAIASSVSNNNVGKSKSRSKNNQNGQEKLHGCNYCKKSFVSPAKLRLHTGKFHAEERLSEPPLHMTAPDHPAMMSFSQSLASEGSNTARFFEEQQQKQQFQGSPASDGLPSQQVPEMELNYVNSSPEDISDFGQTKELTSLPGNGYIPTIHIPEFDNLHSKMDESSEISSEAINALFFT